MPDNNIEDDATSVQSATEVEQPPPFQFPLYKLFLVTAAYAVAFAAFGSIENGGILVAAWFGTALGAWVLAVRTRADLSRSLIVVLGAFVGGLMMPALNGNLADPALQRAMLFWPIVFAAVGGLLFAGAARLFRR